MVPSSDQKESWTFPSEFSAEVRGFRLGMTYADVLETVSERGGMIEGDGSAERAAALKVDANSQGQPIRAGYEVRELRLPLKIEMEDGFVVETEPFLQAVVIRNAVDFAIGPQSFERRYGLGDSETIEIIFASPLMGGAAQSIKYKIDYNEPLDFETVKQTVFGKYGKYPSAEDAPGTWSFDFGASYLFANRKQSMYRGYMKYPEGDGTLTRCLSIQERFLTSDDDVSYYYHQRDRGMTDGLNKIYLEDCDGALQVGVDTREMTLVTSISVIIEDKRSIFEDVKALDEFFDEVVQQHLESPTGKKEAPDL